jgi:hypothetical protein
VGDRHEPLWASSLADQPRREEDFAPVAPVKRAAPTRRRPGQGAAAVVAIVAVVAVLLMAPLAERSALLIEDVPSYWGDVQMTCHTARFADDDRALELFNCRAIDGGTLPPGVYGSPDDTWTSDITRRDARVNRIRISPDGALTGWAAY